MYNEEFIPRVFKALGHPIRYKIVKYLMDCPKCVCKLNENIEFSQSNLSQHLKILKEVGILKCEKIGLNIVYSIADDSVKNIIKSAENFMEYYLNNMK
jgi:DNA-binding transcriptional ArsR family regulator